MNCQTNCQTNPLFLTNHAEYTMNNKDTQHLYL